MFLGKIRYEFLGRMRRPAGLPPKTIRDPHLDLGASPSVVFETSLVLSLLLVIVTFRFFPSVSRNSSYVQFQQEFVKFEDIQNTRQENRPPPPPRPPIPIESPADEALDDINLASTELDARADVPPPPPTAGDAEDEYFVAVEEMPQPIGGLESILRNVVYPEIARRAGIQGVVYVLAFVNEKGEVTRTDIQKGIGAGCDEAAAAAVSKAKFIPGLQRGKPMKVRVAIPIRFQLSR